jgi:hypothetical protein
MQTTNACRIARGLVVACLAACGTLASVTGTGGGGGGATAAQIDEFMARSKNSDDMANESADKLSGAVLAKEKQQEINDKIEAAKKEPDPKEREAKIRRAQQERNVALKEADWVAANEKLEKELDEAKKAAARAGIFNLALALLIDADLVKRGKEMTSAPPDPMVATKLKEVGETVKYLGEQMDSLQVVVGKSKALMSACKLTALPASSSDTPMRVNDVK